jgi:hypothetical protein
MLILEATNTGPKCHLSDHKKEGKKRFLSSDNLELKLASAET